MTLFWVKSEQLDREQLSAVEGIPIEASFLLRGPAGSGKTNILLLRAKSLVLRGIANVKIVVFTQSLRQFVALGCENYGIDPNLAVTQMSFFKDILREHGVAYELTNDFESDRTLLAGKILALIEQRRLTNAYIEALLIDESQDYTDTELLVFRSLTTRLILATDSRQSIYKSGDTDGVMQKLVDDQVVSLRYHYRSGLKICKVADAILAGNAAFARVQEGCHYREADQPSSVKANQLPDFDDQLEQIVKNLIPQFELYPGERLGVLFPKREQASQFAELAQQRLSDDHAEMLRIETIHASKGWEFRAVHIGGCEALPRMGGVQKRLIYTALLRGKTSAQIYYSGHLPGYLTSALAVLDAPAKEPTINDLLGRTS